jgi:hypothetical protein
VDVLALMEDLPTPKTKKHISFVQWQQGDDDRKISVSRLHVARASPGTWETADLTLLAERPSTTKARAFLESMADSPPEDPIPYYVGPAMTPAFENTLHPGTQLRRLGTIPGINTLYWHLGKKNSGTALHCEDADLRSCNLVVSPGYKIWLMVHYDDNEKLENLVRQRWATGDCGQAVRHLNLFLPPSALDEAGIRFDVIVAGQTELVATRPRQYQLVVNYTDCLAVSINYLHPGEPTFPEDVAACEQCGLFHVKHPSIRRTNTATAADDTDEDEAEDEPRSTNLNRKRA